MLQAPQGLHAFFPRLLSLQECRLGEQQPASRSRRAPLKSSGKCRPTYDMERDKGMAANVAPFMPSAAEIANCKWLTEAEVDVYVTEYSRTRIYRGAGYKATGCGAVPIKKHRRNAHLSPDAPSTCPRCMSQAKAIGARIRRPAPRKSMRNSACANMIGFHLVEGAGHWVQQEQPERTTELLLAFLRHPSPSAGERGDDRETFALQSSR